MTQIEEAEMIQVGGQEYRIQRPDLDRNIPAMVRQANEIGAHDPGARGRRERGAA